MDADAKQMKKVAWKVYKAAGPILFGSGGSEKMRRTCAKLRAIADSGKLPAEIAEEMRAQITDLDRHAFSPDTREAFEKWFMGRFGDHVVAHLKDAKNSAWIACGVIFGLVAVRALTMRTDDIKIHPLTMIVVVAAILAGTALITWLTVALMLKKHKRLLFKHFGPKCLSKK